MGISKRQLVNTTKKMKNYTDEQISGVSQVSANFMSENGYGKLRYYGGKFQYYDETVMSWVDLEITGDNKYIMQMVPRSMETMIGICDYKNNCIKLKWKEPSNTILDNQVVCIVDGVKIVRKEGSSPTSETDGELVLDIKAKDFGAFSNKWFIDNTTNFVLGSTYYYHFYPYSDLGVMNQSSINEVSVLYKDYPIYGFKIDQNESDPLSMITYIGDNVVFTPAHMDYDNNVFNYGDWKNAWFIENCKPCMLKYDGTVDYYLDPNDYTKKLDGTESDIANVNYEGNAMVGIPKVYWKIVDNGDDTANIYFSDKKVDDDFHCWSHIDNNGNEIDYCYMPIYNGIVINGKLRSLSLAQIPSSGYTAQQEIDYAKANNVGDDVIWYTEVFCDRMLINLLLILIAKSTDTQTAFGFGCYNSTSTLYCSNDNDKGLFHGYGSNLPGNPLKVFGMNNWWGNIWRRIAGLILDSGVYKIKMTYGKNDGSTVDGYNLDGAGYIEINDSAPSGTSPGYINKMLFNAHGLIPITTNGSSTTYYCDRLYFDNSIVGYGYVGGCYVDGGTGAMATSISYPSSLTTQYTGACLSCKPLAS